MTIRPVLGVSLAALGLACATASGADAQDRVRWKLASSYGSSLVPLGENIQRVIDNVDTMSGGSFQIRFNEPGALVPALEVFDAVSKGSVESSYTSTGFQIRFNEPGASGPAPR